MIGPGPLTDVLAEFVEQAIEDDITRRINAAGHAVYEEWRTRSNRDAYVDQAIREGAYRAVRDVLAQEYVTLHPKPGTPSRQVVDVDLPEVDE